MRHIDPLPRTFEDLDEPKLEQERALPLGDARVVFANYELLRLDFPHLRDREESEIDTWVVGNAAWLSLAQTEPSAVNAKLRTTGDAQFVARPPRYGRALIAPARDDDGQVVGLLDLKGAGVRAKPSHASHASGLMLLSEALSDLMLREAIEAVFRHAGTLFRCLPVYAILDLGFDFTKDGRRTAAGMQVRQAHRRRRGGVELPALGADEQLVKFEIEMLLRQYGITSANRGTHIAASRNAEGATTFRYSNQPVDIYSSSALDTFAQMIGLEPGDIWEGINIQNTRTVSRQPSRATLVDFGHYEVRPRFEIPVVSLVNDRVMRWGGGFGVDHPYFMQPRPELALPVDDWGRSSPAERGVFRPFPGVRYDRPGLRGEVWALRWRAREWGRAEIAQALAQLLAAATSRWD